ncbi:MAG: peptidylprolyl isomerase [Gemmobacter sp.]
MTTIHKEPLVHFFLIGAVIFGLYAVLDDSPPPQAKNAIVVSDDDARRLVAEFEATWRRPPSVQELGEIIDATIREEVYVREALALGLDRDDAVIRRRLQMKMEFLTESGAEVVTPDDATLQAHLDANPDLFTEAPLVAMEQVMLDNADPAAAAEALARLRQGEDPASVGRPTMLPFAIRPSPPRVIDRVFGPDFFTAIATLPVGTWEGPVDSAFGTHLLRITDRREGRIPPLAEIRDKVEQDWRGAFVVKLREERLAALMSRYQVTRPDPAAVLQQ